MGVRVSAVPRVWPGILASSLAASLIWGKVPDPFMPVFSSVKEGGYPRILMRTTGVTMHVGCRRVLGM